MATKENLEANFQRAYKKANTTKQPLPPDIMLQLYAFYKQATDKGGMNNAKQSGKDVRNAFKLNALLQVKGFSKTEAKKEYIKLVDKHIID